MSVYSFSFFFGHIPIIRKVVEDGEEMVTLLQKW
jgi:hypothetical protein